MKPMSAVDSPVSVVDVYDSASLIGKDFERIIELHGVEIIQELMPKVIRVLEQLELLAAQWEKENDELNELRTAVHHLECEKAERTSERAKFDKELEQIEEQWRQERNNLYKKIDGTQDENRTLRHKLKEKEIELSPFLERKEVSFQAELVDRLEQENRQLRESARSKEKDLTRKNLDLESMQEQVEQLTKANFELRHRQNLTETEAEKLLTDKADLELDLKRKEAEIQEIQNKLKVSSAELASPAVEQPPPLPGPPGGQLLKGKALLDPKDPNRPQFTIHDLRKVLMDRNDLKRRLLEVEQELKAYRKQEDEQQYAVQGPINKEPDEKLYGRRRDLGIRKFFRFFFGDSNDSSPKHGPRSFFS